VHFLLQGWKERAWARAARPQEGGHQDAGFSRGDRPRRPGEHALSGLLQRQGKTDQRPAVWGVSDREDGEEGWREQIEKGGRGDEGGEEMGRGNIWEGARNCQFDEFFYLLCPVLLLDRKERYPSHEDQNLPPRNEIGTPVQLISSLAQKEMFDSLLHLEHALMTPRTDSLYSSSVWRF